MKTMKLLLVILLCCEVGLKVVWSEDAAGSVQAGGPASASIVFDNCHDPVIDRTLANFPPVASKVANTLWQPKNGKLFHGYIVPSAQPGDNPSGYREKLNQYIALTGVAPSLTRIDVYIGDDTGPYPDWSSKTYAKSIYVIHDCGMIPIVTFFPMCKPHWTKADISNAWKLADILGGAHDAWLTDMARSFKATRKPIMLLPLPAPNVWQWAWGISGDWKAAGYISAYKHIADIFRKEGADNVAFCFGPEMSAGDHDWQSYWRFYPGDEEVDYVAPNISNKIPAGAMDWILRHIPQKPVLYSSWTLQPGLFRWYCPSGGPPTAQAYTRDMFEFSLNRWPANMTGLVFNGYSESTLGGTDAASQGLTTEYLAGIKNDKFLNGPLDWKNLGDQLYTNGGIVTNVPHAPK